MLSLATSVYRELVSSLLLRVLLGLVVVWLSQWMWSRRRLYATSWQIPGPLALPFLGNAVQLGAFSSHQNMINCLARMKDHYGGFWRIWMGPALCVVITEADDFENILMSKATSIKGGKYKLLTTGMGNGLVTLSGEKWKHHRNMINPVFSSKRMKGYQNVHNKNSGRLVHGMKEICNKGYNDVSAIAMRYAADETCHGLFELKTKFYEGNDDFILALTRWAAFMTFERICKVWLSSDIAYRFTTHHKMFMYFRNLYHAFYNTKILDTIKRINESKSKPSSERIDGSADNLQREDKSDKSDNGITLSDETGDNQLTVMSVLSEALRQGEITEEDVFGEFHNFLTAAIDTMTIQVSSFMLLMAMHPVYQERVWREIKGLFQDDLDGDVTTEHLTQLPFLDQCMKETMRLFATGPLQLRYLNEDFYLKSRNITLPAGTNIALCNFLLHKNPKYWKDPHLFMPERFADNSTKRPHFSFVPFSAGQRNCIAQVYGNDSFKTAAIHVIRNYVLYTDQRIENLTFISNVSVRSGIGYNLKVFKRDQTL